MYAAEIDFGSDELGVSGLGVGFERPDSNQRPAAHPVSTKVDRTTINATGPDFFNEACILLVSLDLPHAPPYAADETPAGADYGQICNEGLQRSVI